MRFHAALVLLLSLAATSYGASSESSGNGNNNGNGGGNGNGNGNGNSGNGNNGNGNGNNGNGNGNGGTKPGGGKGDPILTDFSGRSFEFMGQVGSTYSIISEKTHQLSMKLKEGKMWDHDGSYMSTFGLKYQDHTVVVENVGNSMLVTLDGEPLKMKQDETEAEHILGMAQGELQLLWQLHRPSLGNALEINTEMLNIIIWMTPAGTRDEGGKVQPAYLNFDVTLLAQPAHNAMEGIIGGSYSKVAAGVTEEDDFKFHGVESEYEMADLFDNAHSKCLFAKGGPIIRSRKMIESRVAFPLRATFA